MLKRIRALFGRKDQKSEGGVSAVEAALDRPPVHHGPKIQHNPIPEQDLDPDAVKIVRRLSRFEHTAYLVGGCVRDLLLDRHPKDYDIGTSATPRQVKRLFRNCRIIGRRFRLAHIYFHGGKVIEVATFRSRDLESNGNGNADTDGGDDEDLLIRDDNVFGTPEEDALRRDFTINQLFYDVNAESVIDHADGLGDLRRRYVRAIGDAEIRFREDPIRILRAIKFAARLDFQIEPDTLKALRHHRTEIPKAATPRVLEEINRFCRGGAARASFDLLRETRVFEVVLPEFHEGYRGERTTWAFARQLLDGIDERRAAGQPVSTGEILAALMLPLVAERLGWKHDGTVEPTRGLDVRALADEYLLPMATRLRLPRKEQERCRQIVSTLYRMVPARRLRRSTRQSILRRECLPETLWLLGRLATHYGETFREALAYWRRAVDELEQGGKGAGPAEQRAVGRRSRQDTQQGRAGQGRRRSRAKRRPEAERKPTEQEPKKDMPSKWDDRYFFAALPSVPDIEETQTAGAESADDRGENQTGGEPPSGEARPKRRRRRRRSGRGRGRRSTEAAGADAESPPVDNTSGGD